MADTKLHAVKIAHSSFWFIDQDGRNRVALRGDEVEVGSEDFDRGERHGAFVLDGPEVEDAGGAEVKPAKVDVILAEVGDDPEKAAAALEAEQARGDDARKTLVEKLQAVVDAGA